MRDPKWKRKPRERPREILEAALAVFGRQGVANTAVDDIAAAAGVSKGTIYLYFESKEDLFSQATRHALQEVPRPDPPRPPVTAARHLAQTVARHWDYLTSPAVATATQLVQAEARRFPELAKFYQLDVVERFAADIAVILRRGAEVGEFRTTDPVAAARMLTALVTQLAQWRATGEVGSAAEKSSETVLSELTDFYLEAITASDAAFPQADGA